MTHNSQVTELFADIKEHVLYLQELGVDNLVVNFAEEQELSSVKSGPVLQRSSPQARTEIGANASTPAVVIPEIPIVAAAAAKNRPASRMRALPSLSERPKTAVPRSIDPVEITESGFPGEASGTETVGGEFLVGENARALPDSEETIEQIRHDIGNCVRCPLHEGRTKIVHTTGNFEADLMFVGEAPGADEDAKGEPFVGRAGKLLTQIIEAIGYSRDDVVIGNINRCRPPGNRQPTLPEAHTCRPFLMREIAVIKPKVIVVMGNTALHNLLDTKVGISKMRGQFHDYFNVKVMPTFHPAYLLRDPSKKREVWEDMKMVRDLLAGKG